MSAPVCAAPACDQPAAVLCRTCIAYLCAGHDEELHAGRRAAVQADAHERTAPDPVADAAFFDGLSLDERAEYADDGGADELPSGFFSKVSMISQALVDMVIRPPRAQYSLPDLGPPQIAMACGVQLVRREFSVTNARGLRVECSIWEPLVDNSADLPIVIYTHGNSSCRVAVVESPVLYTVAAAGIRLVALDFAGSGLSEGDYVSLGAHEQHDVAALIAHLRATEGPGARIGLWGTSMGAVSAILHSSASGEEHVDALVLDSPFSSFTQLARDLASDGSIPVVVRGGLQRVALWALRWAIKRSAQFDLKHLEIEPHASRCRVPALFAAGKYDQLVRPGHVRRLHDLWGGEDTHMFEFHGDHNSPRPQEFYRRARELLVRALQPPREFEAMPPAMRDSSGGDSDDDAGVADPDDLLPPPPPPSSEPEPASPPPHPLPRSPPTPPSPLAT